jgi:hypothetical protein
MLNNLNIYKNYAEVGQTRSAATVSHRIGNGTI